MFDAVAVPEELAPPTHSVARLVQSVCVSVDRSAPAVVVAVSGELDMETVPAVLESTAGCGDGVVAAVIVDVREVSFCASAGFGMLVELRRRCADLPFAVVANQTAVLRPLGVLGLDAVLDVHPDLASARRAVATLIPAARQE